MSDSSLARMLSTPIRGSVVFNRHFLRWFSPALLSEQFSTALWTLLFPVYSLSLAFANASRTIWKIKQCIQFASGAHRGSRLLGVNTDCNRRGLQATLALTQPGLCGLNCYFYGNEYISASFKNAGDNFQRWDLSHASSVNYQGRRQTNTMGWW